MITKCHWGFAETIFILSLCILQTYARLNPKRGRTDFIPNSWQMGIASGKEEGSRRNFVQSSGLPCKAESTIEMSMGEEDNKCRE